MTKIEMKSDLNELAISAETMPNDAPEVAPDGAFSPQRSKPDWDEMMLDYAAIEKRAQEMRSEVAWAIMGSVRDWATNLFRQGKAKAQAAAQATLESHAQSS